jgi:hypothetical protein
MALSEFEKEALEQIELGLRASGVKASARRLTEPRPGRSRAWILTAGAAIAVGFTLVLAGLISKTIVISIVGFLLIVAATTVAGSSPAARWSPSKRTKIRR